MGWEIGFRQGQGSLLTGSFIENLLLAYHVLCFTKGVLVVKNLPASAGDIRDLGSIPGSGGSPGGGYGNPLQYSCLENPKDRSWQATVRRVAKRHD